jgi:hypothetical protein
MIEKLFNNKKITKATEIILWFLVFLAAFAYMATAFVREVNVDAAYYLGVVDSIYGGFVPIRDFLSSYTPLSFYLLLLVRVFTHDFTAYLIILFAIIIASSFVLHKIAYRLSSDKILSLLVQLLFLIQVFLFEGTYYVLEPFIVLFGLLSIWFMLNKTDSVKHILLSGFFAGAAFMSKQYGLAFFAGGLIYFTFLQIGIKEKINKILWFCLGFAVLPLLFLIYFMLNGVDLWSFIAAYSGGDYGQRENSHWLAGILELFNIRKFLTIFLLPLFFVLYKRRELIPLALSMFAMIALFTFQFYFQLFDHYYILIIPLILILFGLMFLYDNKYFKLGILVLLFLHSCYLGKKVVRDAYYTVKNNPKSEQIQQLNKIKPEIKDSDVLFVLGVSYMNYYYLLDKQPPLFSVYGYSFGNETDEEMIAKIENATVIITATGHFNNVRNNSQDIYSVVRGQNFEEIYIDERMTVLRRNNE